MRSTRAFGRRFGVGALVAAFLFGLAAVAGAQQSLPAPKDEPTQADIERAGQHMQAGVAFITDPGGERPEEAYPEFRKAYELSGSLNALQNLAYCAMKLELDGEAIALYDRFLKLKGDSIDPENKASVERDLRALKTAVARVTISTDKPGVLITDVRTPNRGEPIRNTYKGSIQGETFGIHPGSHVFTASLEGEKDLVWKVEIESGAKLSHEFLFDPGGPVTAEGFEEKPKPEPKPDETTEEAGGGGLPVYVWVTGGITLAAAVPMTVFMITASTKNSDYEENLLGKAPLSEQEDARDTIKTHNLLADVFLGVTAAGAATTLILALTAPSDDEAAAGAPGARIGGVHVAPAVDPHGGGAALVSGSF